jgi:hypothetical protein
MAKKKKDDEIDIEKTQAKVDEPPKKKEEKGIQPDTSPIILKRTVPLPIKPMPIVVPEPTVVTDVFTKFGGWIFKNGRIFTKEKFWLLTEEAKSGIIPQFKKPYFDAKSMASFSRQMKKQG